MKPVFIVLQRGEELPDSAWTTRELAEKRARELGSPEDSWVHETVLQGD